MLKHLFHIDSLISTLLVFIVLVYLGFYFNLDFLDPVQNVIQEFYLSDFVFSKMRDLDKVTIDSNIVIVNVGTLNRIGIAEELNIINKYNPKVVGIDLFFRNTQTPESDSILSNALSKVNNLVLVSKVDYNEEKDAYDSVETSNPLFNQYGMNGYANFITDTSKKADYFCTVRDFYPKVQVENSNLLAFSLKITQSYDSTSVQKFLSRDKDVEIINFRRNINKYRTIDVNELFDRQDSLQFITGKIVLMGILGPDTSTLVDEDVFFTPLNKEFVGKSLPDMYGVTIHANIISMILEGKFINSMPYWLSMVLLFVIVYTNMSAFRYLNKHIEDWYDLVSTSSIACELILLLIFILYIHYLLDYEIQINAVFFAMIMNVPVFEMYDGFFKPNTLKIYKCLMKNIRNNKKFSKSEQSHSERNEVE
jgi:CHASE2 domain-containing sensor protein